MHVKSVASVVALLLAVASARYAGVGQDFQCNGVQFFPQCSADQFLTNMAQCNQNLYRGYPYRNTAQCMANVDRWMGCMQTYLGQCMSSSCPSVVTSFDGMQQFMPIINRFMSANSLDALYVAIDSTIDDVITQFGLQVPAELQQFKQRGVKNLPIPLPGHEGLTIDQYITEMVCPVPGQMPRSFQKLLPSIQMTWKMLTMLGLTDTTQTVPFCDGDFTTYFVQSILEHLQGFYRSTSRSEFCNVQKSFANVVDTVLNKKCDFNQLSAMFSQVGISPSVIGMFKNSAQIMLDVSGCQGQGYNNEMWSSSSYQRNRFPSNFNNFRNPFQNNFQRYNRRY